MTFLHTYPKLTFYRNKNKLIAKSAVNQQVPEPNPVIADLASIQTLEVAKPKSVSKDAPLPGPPSIIPNKVFIIANKMISSPNKVVGPKV